MNHKLIIVGASILTATVTFVGTSQALKTSNNPGLRPNLPAASLPTSSLSAQEAIKVNNALGEIAADVGVTGDSYSQARVLKETPLGRLLLIPGTNGACLVLANAASCGDPGAPGNHFIALATEAPEDTLIGGGIADESVHRVTFLSGGKLVAVGSVHGGVFQFTQAGDVHPGSDIEFKAQ